MNVARCDNCGRETVDSRRFTDEAREYAAQIEYSFMTIHVEHNEDIQHFDACSWPCVADMALKRAAEQVSS